MRVFFFHLEKKRGECVHTDVEETSWNQEEVLTHTHTAGKRSRPSQLTVFKSEDLLCLTAFAEGSFTLVNIQPPDPAAVNSNTLKNTF